MKTTSSSVVFWSCHTPQRSLGIKQDIISDVLNIMRNKLLLEIGVKLDVTSIFVKTRFLLYRLTFLI